MERIRRGTSDPLHRRRPQIAVPTMSGESPYSCDQRKYGQRCSLGAQTVTGNGYLGYMKLQPVKRKLHAIDIENLIGSSNPTEQQVIECRHAYKRWLVDGDLVFLACSHRASAAVAFGWPNAKHCRRSGADGADLALINALRNDPAVRRCGGVVIASGDGIFTNAVEWLKGQGLFVTVVSRRESLSRQLSRAANDVAYLPTRTAIEYSRPANSLSSD